MKFDNFRKRMHEYRERLDATLASLDLPDGLDVDADIAVEMESAIVKLETFTKITHAEHAERVVASITSDMARLAEYRKTFDNCTRNLSRRFVPHREEIQQQWDEAAQQMAILQERIRRNSQTLQQLNERNNQ